MNDRNYLVTNNLLDKLPLFATDIEIAVAIVGKARAERWRKERLPTLERKGFPAVDAFHGGRAVPLVRKFYEAYFGITAGFAMAKPGGEDRVGMWLGRRLEKRLTMKSDAVRRERMSLMLTLAPTTRQSCELSRNIELRQQQNTQPGKPADPHPRAVH
jgi:hypothetical protein